MVVLHFTDYFSFSKLKNLLSRLVKITNVCVMIIRCNMFILIHDKFKIEFPIEVLNIEEQKFSINISIFNDLLKTFSSNSYCKIEIKESSKISKFEFYELIVYCNNKKKIDEHTSKKMSIKSTNLFSDYKINNDICFSNFSSFNIKESLWCIDKFILPFKEIDYNFQNGKLIINSNDDNEGYSGISHINMSSLNHESVNGTINSFELLNILWLHETISPFVYLYKDVETLKFYLISEFIYDSEVYSRIFFSI